MYIYYIYLGVALVLLVLYIIAKCHKYDLKELFLKMILSVLFVTLPLIIAYKTSSFTSFHLFIILGLLCGLIGDILLDLKYIDMERTVGYSYGGFIAFGIGHIFYMLALIINLYQKGTWLYLIFALVLDLILSAATILLEKPLKLNYGRYKKISFIYALGLFGTCSVSLFLSIQNGFKILPLTLVFIGAVLFAASDLILSGTYFGEGKERPIDFVLNYSTYYAAQFIIALSLLFL